MALVLDRGGTSLDHVAIGVPDTLRGVEFMAKRLGLQPVLADPEPDQFYWSAALHMGSGRFLEILGPNPSFKRFNPFIEIVKRLEEPQPLFWYIATDDFSAFEVAARRAGAPVERVETVTYTRHGEVTDYTRGYLGPGFLSVSPNVIQWRSRAERMIGAAGPTFLGLELYHPEAERLNRTFQTLGIAQSVIAGPHQIKLRLGSPEGEIEFAGKGLEFRGIGAMATMAHSFLRWMMNSKGH